jgi:hypothetical protein
VFSIISCQKEDIVEPQTIDIFKVEQSSENTVKNGDIINFNLTTSGIYTLTMMDTIQNQIISRERFIGKIGLNSLKIYTNSLPTKYLSVELKDKNNQQIGKTRIIIN